ncbi:protein kinase [Nonomuraea sp. NPDC050478]|uniref:protein kinase domain-containing protein n=1 Tax=Nonomuraea sp. NPDC050478 TaxID=3364365 RepID=UPI00378744C6
MANPLRDGDPTQIGPYRLHARLGGGGMGQVFLGRSPGGRLVAVKVVRPELADNADFRRRFASEVEAARKVGGFYTAQVVDADTEAARPWLATAYIPGPSLHQAVEEHGPLPLESAAVLGAGLAEGLAAVHACEMVHRDLKPANVILAEDGPRLIDFGIARALDATSHTQTSTVLGTAAFMSPEQAMAQKVGPPSDVFSLGCVLAFASTGRSPFGTGPVHAVVFRVVHGDPDLRGVPAPLAALVAACLAKDPAARPGLEHVLARLTALASPGQGRWLPEALTQVIAERRTLALTALHDPATGTGGGHPRTTAPPPPVHADQPRAPQPLLVHERRLMRGRDPGSHAAAYQIAIYVLLTLFAVVSVSTVVHQFDIADDAGRWRSVETYGDLHESDELISTITWVAQIVSGLALTACWVLWFFRVRVVAEQFAPGRLRYRPSMAVYAWFIPIAGLWLPKQIADDVWHASSPPGRGRTTAPAGLLHTWWAMWLVTFLTWPLFWIDWTTLLATQYERREDNDLYRIYEFTPASWASLALHMAVVPTAIVTARFVRRLSAMQAARLNS